MRSILDGRAVAVAGGSPAADAARRLARALGATVAAPGAAPSTAWYAEPVERPAAEAWAASGAMALTGHPDGPPLPAPGPLASCADGAAALVGAFAAAVGQPVAVDGAALLGERAAIAGLSRRGRGSAGGAARLVRTADGWCAVQLARPEDRELVAAWFEQPMPAGRAEVWEAVERAARGRAAADLVARGRWLGLPCATVVPAVRAADDEQARARGQRVPWRPWLVHGPVTPRPDRPCDRPLVVDLSALWAGPLCAHLLGLAGARVIKVEDPRRPDGARLGPPALFDLLHGGHEMFAVDLSSPIGRARLAALVAQADVVVESSRPRALAALGCAPCAVRAANPGVVWVSITGYGYTGPGSGWVAFGDDAAVAGGVVAGTADDPVFCGDAVADPLAGLCAAVAALGALAASVGVHVDVALREAAGFALGDAPLRALEPDGAPPTLPVAAPRARTPTARARPLGADTAALRRELALP